MRLTWPHLYTLAKFTLDPYKLSQFLGLNTILPSLHSQLTVTLYPRE